MIDNPLAPAGLSLEARWVAVEALTVYQRLWAELFFRGRLRDRLADPEPLMRVRQVRSEPLVAGVPRLSGAAESLLNRDFVGAIAVVEAEPPDPDEPAEIKREALFQAEGFTLTGQALLPAGADREQHLGLIMKAPFWPVVNARITVAGSGQATWELPLAWINRSLLLGLHLA